VRGLDAHDGVFVAQGHVGGGFSVHLGEVLFGRAGHAFSDDVQEGEDTGFGAIDDTILEVRKIAPSGTAGVGHGGDARAEGEAIRVDAVVAAVGAALSGAGVYMHVHIDQAGGDIQARDIHDFAGPGGRNIGGDGGDLAVRNSHVQDRAGLALAVDDVASFEQ
jgi:hypothetical protein